MRLVDLHSLHFWPITVTAVDVPCASATLTLTAQQTTVSLDIDIQAANDTLALSSQNVSLNIPASAGVLTLTPYNVTVLTGSFTINATSQALSIAEQGATVNAETSFTASAQNLVLSAQNVTVSLDIDVQAGAGSLTITPYVTNTPKLVGAASQTLTITEQSTTVTLVWNVDASTESLVLSTQKAFVSPYIVRSTTHALTITPYKYQGMAAQAHSQTLGLTQILVDDFPRIYDWDFNDAAQWVDSGTFFGQFYIPPTGSYGVSGSELWGDNDDFAGGGGDLFVHWRPLNGYVFEAGKQYRWELVLNDWAPHAVFPTLPIFAVYVGNNLIFEINNGSVPTLGVHSGVVTAAQDDTLFVVMNKVHVWVESIQVWEDDASIAGSIAGIEAAGYEDKLNRRIWPNSSGRTIEPLSKGRIVRVR